MEEDTLVSRIGIPDITLSVENNELALGKCALSNIQLLLVVSKGALLVLALDPLRDAVADLRLRLATLRFLLDCLDRNLVSSKVILPSLVRMNALAKLALGILKHTLVLRDKEATLSVRALSNNELVGVVGISALVTMSARIAGRKAITQLCLAIACGDRSRGGLNSSDRGGHLYFLDLLSRVRVDLRVDFLPSIAVQNLDHRLPIERKAEA